ncbi:hypothetical protein KIW84_054597 [Lathyrus oleraceus]|uniref:Uncharacterized protein n=1 Tax=Pisum sativum TaxID=3888 RepID=A0A9D4WW88_PEA|nr:hypothetical protein KIW84_054597 [Pisum sativum]
MLPPNWLEGVLSEFEEVFQEPKRLPPPRRQVHAIVLKEGEDIPNIRPYRYPHYQKNEIERLVVDMLKFGVIRPSVLWALSNNQTDRTSGIRIGFTTREQKIHQVFHVSLLKKALALTSNQQPLPPMLSEDLELQVSPAAVSAAQNNANGLAEVLIQWQDLPKFEATGEPVEIIKEQFPSFHLEDKVSLLGGGGIDRPLIKNIYKRKGHQ